MRNLMFLLPLVAACEGGGTNGLRNTSFTLSDHADPLTNANDDHLFQLTFEEGGATIEPTTLDITVEIVGDATYQITMDLDDADGDGLFGVGDSLIGREPGPVFDPSLDGETLGVSLTVDDPEIPNRVQQIWSGSWTP